MEKGEFGIRDKKSLLLMALFALYTFEYMVSLTFIDKGSVQVLYSSWQLVLHYADYVLVFGGFLSFAFLRRFGKGISEKQNLPIILCVLYTIVTAVLYFTGRPVLYCSAAMLLAFFIGFVGGAVYFCMSMLLAQSDCMGKVMCIGASFAVAAQYFLQELLDITWILMIILPAGFILTAYLLRRGAGKEITGGSSSPGGEKAKALGRKPLAVILLIVIIMNILSSFYDIWTLKLNISSGYTDNNYYAWPRLFVIGGYLLIGLIGDIKNRKYVPVATLCISMFAIFNPFLLRSAAPYEVNMCIFYIYLGALVSYVNLIFWSAAPRTDFPEFWASAGRAVSCITDVVLALFPLARLPVAVMIGIDIFLLCAMILLMMMNGDLTFGGNEEENTEQEPEKEPADPLDCFAQECRLTPREKEVLEKLLTTEDGTQEIADSLFISRRLLQKHISSIYGKTDTKSRIGLFQKYYSFQSQQNL